MELSIEDLKIIHNAINSYIQDLNDFEGHYYNQMVELQERVDKRLNEVKKNTD